MKPNVSFVTGATKDLNELESEMTRFIRLATGTSLESSRRSAFLTISSWLGMLSGGPSRINLCLTIPETSGQLELDWVGDQQQGRLFLTWSVSPPSTLSPGGFYLSDFLTLTE